CAVVTGGNKGIGLEICRQLASNGILVILTARDEKRGVEAVENLNKSGLSHVVYHQLDVKDPSSIASLANFINTRFKKLDILVSDENPDILKGVMEQTYEKSEGCLKTNYYGTKRVTEALLSFLQLSDSARIVNVSSIYGTLQFIHNEEVKLELSKFETLTEERIDELILWFLKDFKEDKLQANGWPITVAAYKLSKAAVNAYTRMLARKFPNMLINCVHPGYVKTDITCHTGLLTAEEGAKGPVKLALLPDNGPSGHYFDQLDMSTF
ncbi:hypothetical protein IFM89_006675, partial [Coptis chinensis]